MIECEETRNQFDYVLEVVGEEPHDDEVLAILADEQRRRALRYVDARQEPVQLSELAAEVTRSETDEQRDDSAPTDTAERAQTALHHVHLPKLDAAGLLEYDPERRIVCPAET